MSLGKDRRVLVVEDEPILRTLLANQLTSFGYQAATAKNAFEAQKQVAAFDPDVLVVDIDLGLGPTGIELIQALDRAHENLGFVLLTNFSVTTWELAAAKNVGYVSKKDVDDFSVLLQVMEEVLLDIPSEAREFFGAPENPLSALTKHQFEVLSLVARGLSNAEICEQLGVSTGAVEQTLKRIYGSLNLSSQGHSKRVSAANLYNKWRGIREG